MNVSKLCTLYLDHARTYYRKPSGRQTSEYGLMELSIRPLLAVAERRPVRFVSAQTIDTARSWILDNLPDNSRRTVNAKVSRMIRVFRWGAEPQRRHVPAAVAASLLTLRPLPYGRSPAPERPGLAGVERDAINDLLAALAERPDDRRVAPAVQLARLRIATMVELQLDTGMRPGEVCLMDTRHIDRNGPRGTWLYQPPEHKTQHRGRQRVIVLFDEAQHLLRRWQAVSKISHGPLFGVCVDSYRTAVQRALRRAGLPQITPHQIRHTRATEVRRAAGLDAAQVLLGHSSSRTTEIYAGADLGMLINRLAQARGLPG